MNRSASPRTRTHRARAAILGAGLCLLPIACSKPAPPPPSGAGSRAVSAVSPSANGPTGWIASAGAEHWLSPTAAFALDPDQSLLPGLAPEGMHVGFETIVTIEHSGRYRFGAEVEGGAATLSLQPPAGPARQSALKPGDNLSWSDWVQLDTGYVAVSISFTRDGNAKARLRPLWEMAPAGADGFRAEPIPSRLARVPAAAEADTAKAQQVARGRLLLGQLGCVNCHDAPGGATAERAAPNLADIAQRAGAAWMLKWISVPQLMNPGCGMPDVVGDSPEAIAEAQAIVAFLESLAPATDWPAPATEDAVLTAGKTLYESIGCIACHGAPVSKNNTEWSPRVPFGDLTGKWNPAALAAYLREPHLNRPSGRMPSLLLTEQESDQLATYLAHEWGPGSGERPDSTPEQVAQGRAAFTSRGCVNCHDLGDLTPGADIKPLSGLDDTAGCLNPDDALTPRYAISAEDAEALRAAIKIISTWDSTFPAPLDHAALAIESLNCIACHEWHEQGGVSPAIRDKFETQNDVDLGDEGRLPPRLAGVGWKLTSQWLIQVLGDGARARPYMNARMPVFASPHAPALVDELAQTDGVWPGSDAREPESNDRMVQAGLKLVGDGGLNCIACHAFADKPPVGLPGPNIAQFGERLRYDWFKRYIHAPPRFKPGTRMPSFFLTGQSPITTVLAGDTDKQTDAMWDYFSLGELFMPTPEGVMAEGGMALQVKDRPMVLRTFLKGVGSRGIAIGFPRACTSATTPPPRASPTPGPASFSTPPGPGRGGEGTSSVARGQPSGQRRRARSSLPASNPPSGATPRRPTTEATSSTRMVPPPSCPASAR
ncbi:MAG: c-type cytochrome [Phycisphaerales bacterium]|nr:c-type cytochrome [Phycisphaerales bacterium]